MKQFREAILNTFIAGVLVVLPIYLATLLLLKAMQSLARLVKPFAYFLPKWIPAETVMAFLLVLILCFLVGLALRTPMGRAARIRIENSVFQKFPGYTLFRSMSRQIMGEPRGSPKTGH